MLGRNYIATALAMLLGATIAGCGGSTDGNNDSDEGNDDTGPEGANSFTISALSESPQLPSDADQAEEGVTITALVRDDDNNVIPDQTVTFSSASPNGGGGALQANSPETDENGTVGAVLTTPDDPRNRTITVTVTAGQQSDSIDIEVVGTSLSLSGPDSIVFGQEATYTVSLQDAGDTGIRNQSVEVTSQNGNTVSMVNATTNTSGRATFTVEGSNAGPDTLAVESLNLSATKDIVISQDDFTYESPAEGTEVALDTGTNIVLSWQRNGIAIDDGTPITLSTTRGSFGNGESNIQIDTNDGTASTSLSATTAGPARITATGQAGSGTQPTAQRQIEFIATTPANLSAQADPATIGPENESQIKAIVRDANNNPVKNEPVIFNIVADPSGGGLDDSRSTTDRQGVATVTYTAGATTTGIDEVEIQAQTANGGITDSATLTVAERALDVVIGTGNELEEPNNTQFQLPYTVAITDSAGNPVSDAEVQLSVTSLRYFKGQFEAVDTDSPPDGQADIWAYLPYDGQCTSEDVNGNGSLDPGEDLNGDDELTPGNVATVPASVIVNSEGFGEFNLTYPQDQNVWLEVRLRAVASSQGSEGDTSRSIILPALGEDLANVEQEPPGAISPYGTGDCP